MLLKELGKKVGVTSEYALPSNANWKAATKVPLATVYQKHRSLLTRKRMYRG